MAFLDYFERKLSSHYHKAAGGSLLRVAAAKLDEAHQEAKAAVRQRLITFCKDEALPYIAQNYNLDYPPLRMGAADARTYLTDPWGRWETAGTRGRLVAEINAIGYSNARVYTYRDLVNVGAPPLTTFGGISSFFFVAIGKPNPWANSGKWGGGAKWGAAPYTWGSTATVAEINEIRRAIRKWKPAATSCRFIYAVLEVDGMTGLPSAWVYWPCHEEWEQRTDGSYLSFYNYGYAAP